MSLKFVVSLYRVYLSGSFGGVCRFEPSCSVYAEECLRQYPLRTSLFLIIKRLIRCRPFGPFGFDPVPLKARGFHRE